MPWEEREKVLERLRELLYQRQEVLLAIAHGGFVNSNLFRDVDVAVYTGYKVSYDDEPFYVDELRESLEKEFGLPIDVQLLDYAPPSFRLAALRGKLLFERICGLRAILKLHAAEELEALQIKRGKFGVGDIQRDEQVKEEKNLVETNRCEALQPHKDKDEAS